MRRPLLTLAGVLMMSACSGEAPAQNESASAHDANLETTSQPASKPTVITGNRQEKRYIQAMEEGLQSQMRLYARVSPEAAAMMKPVKFNAADRETIRCSVKGLKRAGLSAYIDAGMDTNKTLNKAIDDNPELSIITLDQNPEIMALLQGGEMMKNMSAVDKDKIQAINTDCGVMGMMLKKMTESGAMAAMRTAGAE